VNSAHSLEDCAELSPDKLAYVIGGKRYLRVSTILGAVKDPEYKSEFPDPVIFKKAERLGTRLHNLARKRGIGMKVKLPKDPPFEMVSGWEAFESWWEFRKPEPIYREKTIWSDLWELAGTIDLMDGKGPGFLTDYKWTAKIMWKHVKQMEFYNILYAEWAQKQGVVVRLPRKLRIVRFDTFTGDYEELIWDAEPHMYRPSEISHLETSMCLMNIYEDQQRGIKV